MMSYIGRANIKKSNRAVTFIDMRINFYKSKSNLKSLVGLIYVFTVFKAFPI